MEKLREMRERKGVSRKELAERIGVSEDYIYRLETGRKVNPPLQLVIRISEVLRISTAKLIDHQKTA